MNDFSDVLEANRRYSEGFGLAGLRAPAALGLGVLTCMDSRIEPLAMLGVRPGDAKIFRNAGARLSEDALRSLVLATNLLAVRRIMIVAHTDCALGGISREQVRERLAAAHPAADFAGFEPLAATDQLAALREDAERLRTCPLLPSGTVVGTFRYDVATGLLEDVAD